MQKRLRVEVTADDATGKLIAVYLHVNNGETTETREVEPGRAFADYDAAGRLLGLELQGPCSIGTLTELLRLEPEPVRRFVTSVAPRELVLA